MPHAGFHIALVGASSLKGKEVKEVLERRSFPIRRLTLLDDEERQGQLAEFQGEPTFIRSVDEGSFEQVDFAFFTGSAPFMRHCWKLAEGKGSRLIDLSGVLEEAMPEVPVAGPLATGHLPLGEGKIFAAAHPAALAISSILRRLAASFSLTRAVVNVFEPASERGAAGVAELHQQTMSLLRFQKVPQQVFGSQVAFNLLAACGEGSQASLAEVEQRVGCHVERLLGGRALRPAVRVVQSPTFHAYTFSFYLELEQPRDAADLEEALSGDGFDLRRSSEEAPTAVGAAASDDILVGDIRRDRAGSCGYWLWAAADNLRLSALNAVCIAEELARVRIPRLRVE